MQIQLNGKEYRMVKPPIGNFRGHWEMLFKGEWRKVKNWAILTKLDNNVKI